MSEIPQWAVERALELLGPVATYGNADEVLHYAAEPTCNRYARQVLAFARYIAEHEEEPVDPLVEEAERLALTYHVWDTDPDYCAAKTLALAALKRGIELAARS